MAAKQPLEPSVSFLVRAYRTSLDGISWLNTCDVRKGGLVAGGHNNGDGRVLSFIPATVIRGNKLMTLMIKEGNR